MLLDGKKGLIVGVANKRSIAWSIAEALHREGARLAFNYQGERLEESVRSLAGELPGSLVVPCDVTKDDEIDAMFAKVQGEFGRLDILVHCVAFARKEDLEVEFLATSREGFKMAMDISAFSLAALARRAAPLMEGGGSILALTYLGSEKVVPGYNVMGVAKAALESGIRYLAHDLGKKNIRVNGISSGPISTLAARGVPGFTKMLQIVRERSPLPRNTEPAEVGDAALFLCSPLSRGITGEVLFVDNGYHIMGM
ncbi:MAG TPA: enoyl-ACP reductase [Candidatus Polarisedimenticolia bacterium]|jgi:enoyl-[acyl-carrier protein] reductase I|nr:enoyl-ACP reductase [Candidatus Polarisedimenticolia bacterium]